MTVSHRAVEAFCIRYECGLLLADRQFPNSTTQQVKIRQTNPAASDHSPFDQPAGSREAVAAHKLSLVATNFDGVPRMKNMKIWIGLGVAAVAIGTSVAASASEGAVVPAPVVNAEPAAEGSAPTDAPTTVQTPAPARPQVKGRNRFFGLGALGLLAAGGAAAAVAPGGNGDPASP